MLEIYMSPIGSAKTTPMKFYGTCAEASPNKTLTYLRRQHFANVCLIRKDGQLVASTFDGGNRIEKDNVVRSIVRSQVR